MAAAATARASASRPERRRPSQAAHPRALGLAARALA